MKHESAASFLIAKLKHGEEQTNPLLKTEVLKDPIERYVIIAPDTQHPAISHGRIKYNTYRLKAATS
jgi:hypothetical protein